MSICTDVEEEDPFASFLEDETMKLEEHAEALQIQLEDAKKDLATAQNRICCGLSSR